MKRFSRCVLILILVAILSGVSGYMYENKMIYPMYESTTQLYVVPGEENEASIRANNGGLKEDLLLFQEQCGNICSTESGRNIRGYSTVFNSFIAC